MPIEVELVSTQLNVAETLLGIFAEYTKESRETRNIEQGKTRIQKVCNNGSQLVEVLTLSPGNR